MRAETGTEKEKLIREATLNLFANYKHMPGTSSSAGTGSAMASDYFIKTSEISVREYKTFLQDLLLNGKLDEYEIARPKHREKLSASEQASERAIFDKYFTSPVYKNYPMVFISVDGANMYCEWLQNLIVATGNIKFQNAKVDLPRAQEWTLAALSENKNAEYATADGHLKQSKFLGMVAGSAQANYRETQKAAFSFMYNQNPFDLSPNTDSLLAKKNSASADDKTNFFTCPVRGVYLATQGGMYHMSGNVSEMIRNDNRSYSAKGGNWHSSAEYLQISWKEPEFRGELQPSPYIGFRPIIKGIRK
jgi:formylglycine-generating enzyme required for sulfatase activity